jgi:hypothetical protein
MVTRGLERLRAGAHDVVDVIVAEWRRERPDLDLSAKPLVNRVVRLAVAFRDTIRDEFAVIRITGGEYSVLLELRLSGPPFELTPTSLARDLAMTSGGMTAAIDRVERKGFVARSPNPRGPSRESCRFNS